MNKHYKYNKVVIRLVIGLLPFFLFTFFPLNVEAKKHKQLVILHTNDTHSTIFPINDQLPDTVKAGRGGFLRRMAMLKEERAKHPDLLYFDSGDFFPGVGLLHHVQGRCGDWTDESDGHRCNDHRQPRV